MNDTQAQARPKRPALEEVEAYVRGKGYDDRGSANAFYGNFFYAYHDARAWRRADGTPVLDWRAEADAWHEMGPHYLEPEHPAPAAAPVRTPAPAAPVPEAPAATAAQECIGFSHMAEGQPPAEKRANPNERITTSAALAFSLLTEQAPPPPQGKRSKGKGSHRVHSEGTYRFFPWHFLNFKPLPHGQGSLRPTLANGSSLSFT